MNPSTEEMLAVVEAVNAAHVILLPNNRNVRLAAEQVARLSSKRVSVLPTTSMPQAIAAMMAFSAGEPAEKCSTPCAVPCNRCAPGNHVPCETRR